MAEGTPFQRAETQVGGGGKKVSATAFRTKKSDYPEMLRAALAAARGEIPVGGRLAWEVGLPSTWHHDLDAKVAVGFPDWDVRQGRFHLDYSGEFPELELFAGRRCLF